MLLLRRWDLQTRGRRKGQGIGSAYLVATASGQSKDAHAQDSEVGRQLCRLRDEDVSGWYIELALGRERSGQQADDKRGITDGGLRRSRPVELVNSSQQRS